MNTIALIERHTVHEMVVAYHEAAKEIKQAYKLQGAARNRLSSAFGASYYFHVFSDKSNRYTVDELVADVLSNIKKGAWRVVVGRLGIRNLMCTKQSKELDEQLESGKGLPDITDEAIFGFLEQLHSQIGQLAKDSIMECFDMLRPRRITHKTNEKNARWELGPKIILKYWVEPNWSKGFQIRHHYCQCARVLCNAFSLLDSKGVVKSYGGDLTDAVSTTRQIGVNSGETEYFKFKCYKNGNLHLEFKRMDLVAKLNEIGGAGMLKTGS
ncbi:MAG: DUF4942 domain-containing protein [Kiritimatiellales bacterium]